MLNALPTSCHHRTHSSFTNTLRTVAPSVIRNSQSQGTFCYCSRSTTRLILTPGTISGVTITARPPPPHHPTTTISPSLWSHVASVGFPPTTTSPLPPLARGDHERSRRFLNSRKVQIYAYTGDPRVSAQCQVPQSSEALLHDETTHTMVLVPPASRRTHAHYISLSNGIVATSCSSTVRAGSEMGTCELV
ncbi:hypothetical protein BJV77DRAFT_343348 [Russula vinacea]|nr:hypothetical protein BJV77DRAFT_343348 [Russula vinacea]